MNNALPSLYLFIYIFMLFISYDNTLQHSCTQRPSPWPSCMPDLPLEGHWKWDKGLDFFCVGPLSSWPVVFIIQDPYATTCHHLSGMSLIIFHHVYMFLLIHQYANNKIFLGVTKTQNKSLSISNIYLQIIPTDNIYHSLIDLNVSYIG